MLNDQTKLESAVALVMKTATTLPSKNDKSGTIDDVVPCSPPFHPQNDGVVVVKRDSQTKDFRTSTTSTSSVSKRRLHFAGRAFAELARRSIKRT